MPFEVVLPKVDMDMESGVIAAWKVAEGTFVQQGDILFEMETDKAMMEVESPGTGTIRGLASITGEPIAVGTAVAWIDSEAEAGSSPLGQSEETINIAPAGSAPVGRSEETIDIAPAVTFAASIAVAAASIAPLDALSKDAATVELRATPLARRTARLRDVDLAAVAGTGPRGRIGEKDVEMHAAVSGRLVPFNAVRRIIAQRVAQSTRDVPHFYLTAQVEMTALQDALKQLAPGIVAAAGIKPTMTVLLAHLVGVRLVDHPMINASLEGDAARLHGSVHIGIAMDRDGDLVVPVLRDVQTRTLIELTQEYGRLRDAARSRSILPSDMRGGTFTISNLGMYGVDAFTAIINQPESAILAIGRTVDTPVGRDGQIVLRPMATLSLSSDHRIVDGITAARFMADLRQAIEHPAALL